MALDLLRLDTGTLAIDLCQSQAPSEDSRIPMHVRETEREGGKEGRRTGRRERGKIGSEEEWREEGKEGGRREDWRRGGKIGGEE